MNQGVKIGPEDRLLIDYWRRQLLTANMNGVHEHEAIANVQLRKLLERCGAASPPRDYSELRGRYGRGLTNEQAVQAREWFASGRTLCDIGRTLKCSPASIRNIVLGISYKDAS